MAGDIINSNDLSCKHYAQRHCRNKSDLLIENPINLVSPQIISIILSKICELNVTL